MTRFSFQYIYRLRQKALMHVVIALFIPALLLPALAQDEISKNSLPDAPSPTAPLPGSSPATAATPEHSLTIGHRFRLYTRSIASPEAIIGPAFGAGIGQAQNEPAKWKQGGEGFGKRYASDFARGEINETIRFGIAAIDGEDPRYFRSQEHGFWPRAKHAMFSSFVSQTASGRTIPAFSRFAGIYGAAFISNTWYPNNRAGAGDAAERGSTSLAASVGFQLVREFVPFFGRRGQ